MTRVAKKPIASATCLAGASQRALRQFIRPLSGAEKRRRVFPHKAEEGSRARERGGGRVAREITIKTLGHCCGIRVESDKRDSSRDAKE